MKNLIFTLIILIAFSINMSGKGIDVETARKAAVNVCIMYNPIEKSVSAPDISLARTFSSDNQTPLFYVFNINQTEGFVIIAADDIAKPVIGYSFEGSFPSGELIPSFRFWMKQYADQIDNAIKNNIQPHPEAAAEWQEVLTNSPAKKEVQMIQPLLLTTWNQDNPYNDLCPADAAGPGGHVYVGCVALSMAQVMKYYNYPATGTGSNTLSSWENGGYGTLTVNFAAQTYNWNNMPNRLTTSNTDVAKLCYHCAIACDMYFSPDGSASYTEIIVSALKSYFRYATNCSYKDKYSYTETNWKNLLKAQINAKKPMSYSGSDDTGGHAWNCDGYEGELFHMNWGWGGSANGYFEVAEQTAGGYTFNQNFGAVVDIYPASGYPENCTTSAKLITGAEGTFNDGSGNQNYANNNNCQYLVQPACGQKIQLNFDAMSLGSGDTVFVYNGNSTTAPVLATYSSANIPAANIYLYSNTGALLIRFKTDGSGVAEGWYASYKVSYCSGTETFTTSSGTVSDGSGTCEYKNSSVCTFDLNPTNVNRFDLNFTEFLFPSADTNDYIMIYKNSMSTENLLGKWHGLNVPTQLNIEATRLYVRFRSSASTTGGGFTMQFNATIDVPRNSDNLTQVLLFPNPSENDALISLDAAKPAEITMTILDITGKTIQQHSLSVEEGHNYIQLSVENPGVYFVNLQNSTDIVTLKFIKQ